MLITPYIDASGQMTPQEIDAENIKSIMKEMNQGTDTTTISRRSLLAGQIKVFDYVPDPISIKTDNSGNPLTIAAGGYWCACMRIRRS